MNILGWLVFGFVVGLVARAAVPGRDPVGLFGTVLLGMAGALVGGWAGQILGLYEANDGAGFVGATLGSIVVLLGYNWVRRSRTKKMENEIKIHQEPPSDEKKAA